MNRLKGYKCKFLDSYAYGFTFDNIWLNSFVVNEDNYAVIEVIPVEMEKFFKGETVSDIKLLNKDSSEALYDFWSDHHNKINPAYPKKIFD